MSVAKELKKRTDVRNEDIPEIIHRAERLQQEDDKPAPLNVENAKSIGRELNIREQYIERAIQDLRRERLNHRGTGYSATRAWRARVWILGGVVVGMMALFLLPRSSPVPKNNVATTQPIVEPTTMEHSTSSRHSSEAEEIGAVLQEEPHPVINQRLDSSGGKNHGVTGGEATTISSKKEQAAKQLQERDLPDVAQQLQGEWELVSYVLAKGGEQMEIAITKEPTEIREHWHFSESTYRRVLDRDLSFFGRFVVTEALPEMDTPSMLDGRSFLLIGKMVRSNIPGFQRERDYFYGEIKGHSLVLLYLGSKLPVDSLPTQAHLYRRKQGTF